MRTTALKLAWGTAHFHGHFALDTSDRWREKVHTPLFCSYAPFVHEAPGLFSCGSFIKVHISMTISPPSHDNKEFLVDAIRFIYFFVQIFTLLAFLLKCLWSFMVQGTSSRNFIVVRGTRIIIHSLEFLLFIGFMCENIPVKNHPRLDCSVYSMDIISTHQSHLYGLIGAY